MARRPNIDELREHREVLEAFLQDYREYIDAQKRVKAGFTVAPGVLAEARSALIRRSARAERARAASGVSFAMTPPPMFGGPVLHSLAQQIVAHETSVYGGGPDPFMSANMVLDALATAVGALDDRVAEADRAAVSARPAERKVASASEHLPKLWGRLRGVPARVAFVADLITVAGVVFGALKLFGIA